MQIIPAIDLRDGKCVRLSQGEIERVTVYEGDPVAKAWSFAEAGAELLHVVDLDGAFSGVRSKNRSVVKQIIETVRLPVQVGGGIRSEQDIEELIESGAARVILGTLATESAEGLQNLVARFGEKICVGIDARNGVVMTRGWEAKTNLLASDFAAEISKLGVKRIIYTDIKRDGMLNGPNIDETLLLARTANVKVTVSGGVSSLDDITRLNEVGEPLIDSVIVGKALYEKKFTLEQALQLTTR